MVRSLTTLVIFMALSFSVAAGKVYKWVDADGNTHFGAQAPRDTAYESIAPPPPPPYRGEPTTKSADPELGEKAQTEIGEINKQTRDREAVQKRRNKELCAVAKQNRDTINNRRRISVVDDKGNRRRLSDKERMSRLDEAGKQVKQYCT